MRQRNDGTGEANVLQNEFTAYLLTAIRRRKATYCKNRFERQRAEVYLDLYEFDAMSCVDLDLGAGLPLLEQIDSPRLHQALLQAKERERYIFLARILNERSFIELAEELGISYKAASNSYYRFLERLKRALEEVKDDD